MSFHAAGFLWYLPLCLLPFAIYYLMRRFPAKVTWGAHYALVLALERMRKKLIDEHMLLLCMRVLALALVILAFARLMWQKPLQDTIRDSGTHHVIVFDTSYSMLAGEAGQNRWGRCVQGLHDLLSTLGKGETWSLLSLGAEPRWLVSRAVVGSDTEARAQLEQLKPCEAPTSLPRALRKLRETVEISSCALYLFVDDQASFWQDTDELVAQERPQACYWFCPPLSSRRNVSITDVTPSAEYLLVGHPTRVFARAKNESTEPLQVRVEFLNDGAVAGESSVMLLPGMEEQVYGDMSFAAEGSYFVSARVKPDALPYDDCMHAGVDVVKELTVSVLCPEETAQFTSAWPLLDFVNGAQEDLETYGAMHFVATHPPVTAESLAGCDLVLVADPLTFDDKQAAALKAFVTKGGGLFLAPGMHVDRENWNMVLDAEGLLPARLGDSPEWNFNPGSPFKTITTEGFEALDMAAYIGEDYGRLNMVQFFHSYTMLLDEDQYDGSGEREVLLRFSDQTPCLLRRRVGDGAVVLFASGLNGYENTLPVFKTFYPALHRMLRCTVQAGRFPRTVATDTTFRYRPPSGLGTPVCSLLFENHPSRKPEMRTDTKGVFAEVPGGLPLSGLATFLTTSGPKITRIHVGIQGPRLDSNLQPLGDDLLARVTAAWSTKRVVDGEELRHLLLRSQGGVEIFPWLLAAGIALLLVELAYQRRFSGGRS